jgi:3-oxoacyl-[acyl-carrier-protein] synthase II
MVTGVGWVNTAGMGHGRRSCFAPGGSGSLPKLSKNEVFRRPFPRFGRMDSYSCTGVAGIALALKDAGLDEWAGLRDIAIIASTVHGSLNADADYYDTVIPDEGRLASPNLFVYALPNTYLGEAAIYFGLTGPGFALCESSSSGLHGLCMAMEGIRAGEYEAVVAGICDVGAPPLLGMPGLTPPGALFFVLQGEPMDQHHSYGALTQDDAGMIFFGNKRLENLNNLAAMCTADTHT